MSLLLASAILSCGLSAEPDGTPAPAGSMVVLNEALPGDSARSLASQSPPEPDMRFAAEADAEPEWVIKLGQGSETRYLVARLRPSHLAYKVRTGWVEPQADGTALFSETSFGTCQLKDENVTRLGSDQ